MKKLKFDANIDLDDQQIENLESQIKEEVEKQGYSVDNIRAYHFKISVEVCLSEERNCPNCGERLPTGEITCPKCHQTFECLECEYFDGKECTRPEEVYCYLRDNSLLEEYEKGRGYPLHKSLQ